MIPEVTAPAEMFSSSNNAPDTFATYEDGGQMPWYGNWNKAVEYLNAAKELCGGCVNAEDLFPEDDMCGSFVANAAFVWKVNGNWHKAPEFADPVYEETWSRNQKESIVKARCIAGCPP